MRTSTVDTYMARNHVPMARDFDNDDNEPRPRRSLFQAMDPDDFNDTYGFNYKDLEELCA